MPDCIFCKIARREIPAAVVFEDDRMMAFMDIMPARKGHLLVIPKKHYATVLDIPPGELKEIIAAVQLCAGAAQRAFAPEGFNILQSNGRAAGQVIDHLHFHVIPRAGGDGLRLGWGHEIYAADEIHRYAEKIISAIGADRT